MKRTPVSRHELIADMKMQHKINEADEERNYQEYINSIPEDYKNKYAVTADEELPFNQEKRQ